MTVVVGFNWLVEHDHAVAVIVDGELVFATEEERWTRHKHSPGEPPIKTPADAIRSFAFGGFKALYLQGWLLVKP